MTSRDYFKGKRIAVIGLGPHGEMVADIKFLIKSGALVAVYDLRSEARQKSHLVFLRSIGLANYVCGSIPADDLLDMDMVILSHEYPRSSSFLKGVIEMKIPIEYPETLFFKQAPPVTLVGVMGSSGKATVMSMLIPLLESVSSEHEGQGFFTVDPESSEGILTHLKKVKTGDIVLMRVIEPVMAELHTMRISPQVAVFTTVPSVGSYMKTPFEILAYQTYNNFIVASDAVIDATYAFKFQPKAKMLRTKSSLVPSEWNFPAHLPHDLEDAALALQTARLFKVSDETARTVLASWKSLKGRLEAIKKVKQVEFYNDTASISPDSTCASLSALARNRNVILIFGGVAGTSDFRKLYESLPSHVHTLVSIPGSGTMRERQALSQIKGVNMCAAPSLEESVRMALEHANKGDCVLFSPAFEAGGFDRSRMERGERFVRAVRAL